ncbi:MAG: hypothetical protein HMLKMBBP_03957 [Planctomycetes bacterium]|nr:hypothetical protein [Planctomycetota bacterium]
MKSHRHDIPEPATGAARAAGRVLRAAALALAAAVAAWGGPTAPARAADTSPAAAAKAARSNGTFAVLTDGTYVAADSIVRDKEKKVFDLAGSSAAAQYPQDQVSVAFVGGERVKVTKSHIFDRQEGPYRFWTAILDAEHKLSARAGKAFGDDEAAARSAYEKGVLEAAGACREWGAWTAAGALLGDAKELGVWTQAAIDAALACCPDIDRSDAYPFQSEDAVKAPEWVKWARTLIPLGGRFKNKEEDSNKASRPMKWQKDAFPMVTRNIELWSLEREAVSIVVDVLLQAEATVRALEGLLGRPEHGVDERLEIRFYTNRQDYLTDDSGGSKPPLWSGGFFSPGDGITRFYKEAKGDLRETVSHEMTHHWLERRFFRGGQSYSKQSGYWIVEGFARYVEHTSRDFQKGKTRWDWTGAACVHNSRGIRRAGKLFPASHIIDLSQANFGAMPTDRISVFYEQASATVWFMLNRRGPEGRKALLEYMRRYYHGEFLDLPPIDDAGLVKRDPSTAKPILETWKVLGFDTPGALDAAFGEFLDSLGK